jgi:hypothetical protein
MIAMHKNINVVGRILRHVKWRIETTIAPSICKAITKVRFKMLIYGILRVSRISHFSEPVHINLTSYPKRFPTLYLTLQALLCQSVQPDRITLWIAEADFDLLPRAVLELQNLGISIDRCIDTRSYKKLVPALIKYPDCVHVTADDDLYYSRDWLEGLCVKARNSGNSIVCYRAHCAVIDEASFGFRPYAEWLKEVVTCNSGFDLVATTGAGALYRPGSLHSTAINSELFLTHAPTSDDLWFWWMSRLRNVPTCTTGEIKFLIAWPGSQGSSLYSEFNSFTGNDLAMENLSKHFF